MDGLTAKRVEHEAKPGRYGDGGGLYLKVWPTGSKSWVFRYMREGKSSDMGLGPYPRVSLSKAREQAGELRKQLSSGFDPMKQRVANAEAEKAAEASRKAAEAKRLTFWQAAERYVDLQKVGWKNAKHRAQWTSTLRTYAKPIIGDMDVAAVETDDVLKVLKPIWTTKTETATRVRQRIESVLAWAKQSKLRTGDNPASRENLTHLLPAAAKVRKFGHHEALPYAGLGAFLALVRAKGGISARALEWTILTAARTGETIGARWSEVDLAAKVWTVPAERMKAQREHRVPLCPRALAILAELPHEEGNDHVFIGGRKGKGLSNMAMLEQVQGMDGYEKLTVHGFRSTFRDWAAEQTNFAREVAEAALAHTLKDKTEAAYKRGDMLDKRRKLMEAWANYADVGSGEANVVSINAKRA